MQNAVESGIYGVLLKVAELQFFVLSWGCFRLNVAVAWGSLRRVWLRVASA